MHEIPSTIADITTVYFSRLHGSLTTADRDNHATFNRELDRRQRSLSTESAPDILKIPVKVSIIISDALTLDRSASSRGIRSTRSNRKNSTIPHGSNMESSSRLSNFSWEMHSIFQNYIVFPIQLYSGTLGTSTESSNPRIMCRFIFKRNL